MCVLLFAQVQTAESEAKIVAQYSELVKEAKLQFEREVSSLHPEIQANWKGLSKKDVVIYTVGCLKKNTLECLS